ncbi:extracellular solute-binding protein [Paenibacillus rhizophilus]|uniref:Extracellular solute-binding protein n=1 Tax=Paenibacillus rhizophilus TaxID=1850366 RepID=A0A3N9P6Y6_9BACL|nr:extracellular solute-binding protein [Paenibacillus rhizophilus]RQW11200.1 extracellular solute-binding protein [Paenibacillus rhizophilus]
MKKAVGRLFTGLLGLMLIAGCTSGNTSSTNSATTTNSAKPEGSLVVYTNSGGDGRDVWLKEQAANAGFDISIVSLGGGDLANRAIAEKNNQVADVVFGLNPMEYERMKREDLLQQYEPAWSSGVDKTLGDPEGYYYPVVTQPLFMIYNKDQYSSQTAPKDWTDLATNPEFKDKYTILGLGGGTSKAILVSIISRYLDDTGEYGVSAEGWEMVKNFIQNGHVQGEGEDFFGNVASGERPIAEIWGSGFLQFTNETGADNVDYVVPEIGVPYTVEQTAIFKNSKNIELAKKFVDWFGSAEFQAKWSNQFGSIPVNKDAASQVKPEIKAMLERVHPQKIDWKNASEKIEMWMEKIQLEYVK